MTLTFSVMALVVAVLVVSLFTIKQSLVATNTETKIFKAENSDVNYWDFRSGPALHSRRQDELDQCDTVKLVRTGTDGDSRSFVSFKEC